MSHKKVGIYLIRNTITNLCYVGQSSSIYARWSQHLYGLRKQAERIAGGAEPTGVNRRLAYSWAKYGEDVFEFVIIEECSIPSLTSRESFWLEVFRDVYGVPVANSEGPSDNAMRGMQHTQEARLKIGAAIKGVAKSTEHRKKLSEAHLGRVSSTEHRKRISEARKGMACPWLVGDLNPSRKPGARSRFKGLANPVHNPGVKEKISLKNSKPVVDVNSGQLWASASAAAAELGVSTAAVAYAASGKHGTCKGRRLKYKVEGEE